MFQRIQWENKMLLQIKGVIRVRPHVHAFLEYPLLADVEPLDNSKAA